MPRFLVIGNVLPETIIRDEDHKQREHLGGVGAIMARELARAGAEVTFASAYPKLHANGTDTLRKIERTLASWDIQPNIVTDDRIPAAACTAYVRNGEPYSVRGRFVQLPCMVNTVRLLVPKYDWVLIDTMLNSTDAGEVALLAKNLVVNPCTTRHGRYMHRSLQFRTPDHKRRYDHGRTLVSCNMSEWQDYRKWTGAGSIVAEAAKKEWIIQESRGPSGRLFATSAGSLQIDAVPVPDGADFVGCGDAMTAGLAWAYANDLSPKYEVVNQFISSLLAFNAESYGC